MHVSEERDAAITAAASRDVDGAFIDEGGGGEVIWEGIEVSGLRGRRRRSVGGCATSRVG